MKSNTEVNVCIFFILCFVRKLKSICLNSRSNLLEFIQHNLWTSLFFVYFLIIGITKSSIGIILILFWRTLHIHIPFHCFARIFCLYFIHKLFIYYIILEFLHQLDRSHRHSTLLLLPLRLNNIIVEKTAFRTFSTLNIKLTHIIITQYFLDIQFLKSTAYIFESLFTCVTLSSTLQNSFMLFLLLLHTLVCL